MRCAEHSVFFSGLRTDFLCGKADLGAGRGERSGLAVGVLSECRDDAVRMDMGHVVVGAAGCDAFVGDDSDCGIGTASGLVWLWTVVGLRLDDESRAGRAAAVPARMGRMAGVPRLRRTPVCVEASRSGSGHCSLMLRAMDGSKLRCFSSI